MGERARRAAPVRHDARQPWLLPPPIRPRADRGHAQVFFAAAHARLTEALAADAEFESYDRDQVKRGFTKLRSTIEVLYIGSIIVGLSVGNIVSLPPLVIQHEFAARSFGLLVGLNCALACNWRAP